MTDNELRAHDLAVSLTHAKWITSLSDKYAGAHNDQELADYLETYEEYYSKIMDIVSEVGFSAK